MKASSRPGSRIRVRVRGAVQGVGFRPFIYRLAAELDLAGWVLNDTAGLTVEVEGAREPLERFLERLESERPPRSVIRRVESEWLEPRGLEGFEIRESEEQTRRTALVLPDIAPCADCLAEMLDAEDRRYRYPFTNCTNCGPRFSIVRRLPYDRPNTTMAGFEQCPLCRAEYEDPGNRRFHAQPNACPACGPRLVLWDERGRVLAEEDRALEETALALEAGRIVALKGLGGFHLVCAAGDEQAVSRLRRRKRRPRKPLALMVRDLEQAEELCRPSAEEREALGSVEAPILLLRRREGAPVAPSVAPANPYLGLMLPSTPLHHLLLRRLGAPVVATSGNLSDEPICTDEREALGRLAGIADLFLVHDRPVERHVDDSVAWSVSGSVRLLRRARGHAPLPVAAGSALPPILGVGAHLKSTVALSVGEEVFLSQHIGDLETPEAREAFERVIDDFLLLYETRPVAVAHDLHPRYHSSRWAGAWARGAEDAPALVPVQHHHAHLAACLADAGEPGPALGVTWDGTGLGTDGTIWGGEFLLGEASGFERAAHLLPFRLAGGERAIREPARVALALLWELEGERCLSRDELAPIRHFPGADRHLLGTLLERGRHAPLTTSAGRLFDGIAALCGLSQRVSYEAQAAMELEWAALEEERGAYPLVLEAPAGPGGPRVLDWRPLVSALLEDLGRGVARGRIAARFHNALAEGVVLVARELDPPAVALSGGCFQNRLLLRTASRRLRDEGFRVLLHRQVPPGDGCISLGQVLVAAARI